jgi:dCMP deaminase
MKYPLICHAEENAIMHAARIGMSLKECTAYITWPPCTRCARSLIQAGITQIVYPEKIEIPERWASDFDLSLKMFKEAGIQAKSA